MELPEWIQGYVDQVAAGKPRTLDEIYIDVFHYIGTYGDSDDLPTVIAYMKENKIAMDSIDWLEYIILNYVELDKRGMAAFATLSTRRDKIWKLICDETATK